MITALDLQRITRLLINRKVMGQIEALEKKLTTSEIVESEFAPKNLVTMNSQVKIFDVTMNEISSLRLVYLLTPMLGDQASVISPLGTALLGMKLNESAFYKLRDGSFREIRIDEIIFQPEREGQYEL